jgi:hypothetical protein
VIETTADIDALCAGLGGAERERCLTGPSVIGPPDLRARLALCGGFQGDDAVASVRGGTKVQSLLGLAERGLVGVARRCDSSPRPRRDSLLSLAG